jgi:hypothetical protein
VQPASEEVGVGERVGPGEVVLNGVISEEGVPEGLAVWVGGELGIILRLVELGEVDLWSRLLEGGCGKKRGDRPTFKEKEMRLVSFLKPTGVLQWWRKKLMWKWQ